MHLRWQKIVLFLFVLFLPTQLAFHFWPNFSVIRGIRVDYLSPTIFFTDLLLIILVSLEIKSFKLIGKFTSKKSVVICSLIILNILFSYQPLLTVYHYLRILLLLTFAFCYSTKPDFSSIVSKSLSISLIWVCLLALLQFTLKHSVGGLWYFLGERPLSLSMLNIAKISLADFGMFLRPYSTFPHPNALAGYLLLAYILLLKKKLEIVNILILILTSVTLFLTFSRTAIFSYAVFNLFYFLKQKYYLLVPLIFLPFFLPGNPLSLPERQFLFQDSLSVVNNHLLFGTGMGNYLLASPNYMLQPVHNLFMLLITELGTGLTILLILLIKKNLSSYIPYIAVVVLTGMTDHYWLTSHQNIFLLSLVFAVRYNQLYVRSDQSVH